ncbi:hypothetical protein SAMN05444162_1151 [Paenibacillaceae bacterium GAS479]|nr:hypothetical protein SAMN05444162_1151 [Paenibacillaceae bacterium GAS479]
MSMKSYSSPKVISHQAVEFGTVNISNNFFYQWCKCYNFKPFICKLFYGDGNFKGGSGVSTPLGHLDGWTPKK